MVRPPAVDGAGDGEQATMAIDLLGRCERDAPVVDAVSAESPVALGEFAGTDDADRMT